MITLTAVFLIVALSAYVLFGGADFGGGILEATLSQTSLKEKLQKTLAPVWEANHVWLIAVVVILFVGFPRFYALSMTRLYLPISLGLFAILIRGAFFTLRKYDPAPGRLRRVYSAAFRFSSIVAPFSFGLLLSGLLSTHPASAIDESSDFFSIYVRPWWDAFSVLCGAFVAVLFGYVASVFFYGELSDPKEKALIAKRLWVFFVMTFVLGGLVLVMGNLSGRLELEAGLHPVQISCQVIAFISIFVMIHAMRRGAVWAMRHAAGAQVLSILGGWFVVQHPVLLRIEDRPLTLYEAAAPPITLLWLNIGLVVVLIFVVPLLVILYRVFDGRGDEQRGRGLLPGQLGERSSPTEDAIEHPTARNEE